MGKPWNNLKRDDYGDYPIAIVTIFNFRFSPCRGCLSSVDFFGDPVCPWTGPLLFFAFLLFPFPLRVSPSDNFALDPHCRSAYLWIRRSTISDSLLYRHFPRGDFLLHAEFFSIFHSPSVHTPASLTSPNDLS